MNRLDHDMIAKSLKETRKEMDCDPAYTDAIDNVARRLAFDIWVQDPLFDREEFLKKTKED